jgi:hypothetical protein
MATTPSADALEIGSRQQTMLPCKISVTVRAERKIRRELSFFAVAAMGFSIFSVYDRPTASGGHRIPPHQSRLFTGPIPFIERPRTPIDS